MESNTQDSIINSRCACGIVLIYKPLKQIILDPCCHILHLKCWNKYPKKICPLCNANVEQTTTLSQLTKQVKKNHDDRELYQKYVDMISMTNYDNIYVTDEQTMISFIDVLGIVSGLPFYTVEDGEKLTEDILCLMNTKLVVNGAENLNLSENKIYIANHTTYLDFVVIFNLLKCGFLASSIVNNSWIGRRIQDFIPLLVIDRGVGSNTVEKMREYVRDMGSICVFPEGMFTHPDTLIRFRTGAFYVGHPVQPIVMRFDPVIYDSDLTQFITKILAKPDITIYVDILPTEYPPFDGKKIEAIRHKMGRVANLACSRVSNRDIRD
ncbi:MAG: lysophospholipid acyltransferase [Hyperionvirus sp.]|uniref:Lysophospholipid acyltransferase n=1 Tax=Hyperionvirus sp. TaxID=2487770 RepID=A0A3G5A8E7_9VIRU|nr:MAG: lysophospholipid acyltransferase [Hyperionvirus sp.]